MIRNIPQSIDDFLALCTKCQETQEEVLLDILENAKDTEIGKKFNFKSISSIEEFKENIKPTTWNDIKDYSKQMQKGKSDVLFAGKPPFFVCTSGSTGNIKIIPESENGKYIKSLTTNLRVGAIEKYVPTLKEGKIFPLVNHAVEGYTEANIPFGSASGITLQIAPKSVQQKVSFPLELLEIDYASDNDYFMMRFAMCEDVRITYGNNAGRLKQLFDVVIEHSDQLIDDIEKGELKGIQRLPKDIQDKLQQILTPNPKYAEYLRIEKQKYGKLLPKSYWPNLKVVTSWLSGSVGRYVEDIYELLDKDILLFDVGYGATEGKFNIPLQPNQKEGVLTIYGIFYEFRGVDDGVFYLAHEVEVGKSYEIYITTYSGFYRYNIGDIIYVNSYTNATPNIYFLQKSGDILNICGEKIAASSLIPIVEQATQEVINAKPFHWCVIPDENERCYHFCIEFSKDELDINKIQVLLSDKLEELLNKNTLIYPIFREQNLINKLKLTIMKSGWQTALYEEALKNGRSSTQTKLPLIYKAIPLKHFAL